ncbi:MAG: hypothetical protein WCY68_01400, partial [Desulfuromonadales bacterium]
FNNFSATTDIKKIRSETKVVDGKYCRNLASSKIIINIPMLIVVVLFMQMPCAYICDIIYYKINLIFNSKNKKNIFLKLLSLLIVFLVLLISIFVSITMCFVDVVLPASVLKYKYIISLPFILSLYVIVFAFGKTRGLFGK